MHRLLGRDGCRVIVDEWARRVKPRIKPETVAARKQAKRLKNANLFSPIYSGEIISDQWFTPRRVKAIGVVFADKLNSHPGNKPIPPEKRAEYAQYMRKHQKLLYWQQRNQIQMDKARHQAEKEAIEYVKEQLTNELLEESMKQQVDADEKGVLIRHQLEEYRYRQQQMMLLPKDLVDRQKLKRRLVDFVETK